MGVTPDEKPQENLAQAADVVNTESEQAALKDSENISFDELKRQAYAEANAQKSAATAPKPKPVAKKPAVKKPVAKPKPAPKPVKEDKPVV